MPNNGIINDINYGEISDNELAVLSVRGRNLALLFQQLPETQKKPREQ